MESLQKNNDPSDILKNVAVFVDLKEQPQALSLLAAKMPRRKFTKGNVLTDQGQTGSELFVLVSGSVSIFKKTPEGDAYKVAILSGQNYPAFGEGGLMEGEVRSATVICDTEVECLVFDRKDFNEFCDQYPQYALPLLTRIAKGIMARLNQTSQDLMLLHNALMTEIRSS